MKKLLCYLTLFALIVIIASPPLLRLFYKEKEKEVIADRFSLLTCTRDSYMIASSYKNNEPINLKFTFFKNDSKLTALDNDYEMEYLLYNALKSINDNGPLSDEDSPDEGLESDNVLMDYMIIYDNVDSNSLIEFQEYRKTLTTQQQYYISNGYSCNIIE